MEAVKRNKIFNCFKYSFIALFPILSIYNGISIISLGTVFLIIIMILEIFINKGKIDINKKIFFIIIFLSCLNIIIGLSFINRINLNGYLNNTLQMIEVAIICTYFAKSSIADKNTFYKYIKAVALISSFFLFMQLYFYTKGKIIYGLLPLINQERLNEYTNLSISYGRPNSFFLEPAHFAIYVLPVYALSLLKKEYIVSLIFFLALIFSTSSTGILIGIAITIYFFCKEKNIPIIIKWIFFIIILIFLLQFIPLINESAFIKKITFISLKNNIRVFGALKYFEYYNTKEVFLGVGLNQISNYINLYSGINIKNYANAIIFSFLSFGIVGGTIWTAYAFSLYNLNKNKSLFIIFILICFTDQILFNRNLIYLLMMLYIYS